MSYQLTQATRKIRALEGRIRIVQGGTSAGKTIGILQHLIDLAQRDKRPTLTSIVSESFPHLKRGVIRDFLSIMQEQHYFSEKRWNKTDYVYTFETGSKMEFFSADQPGKVRGPRRDRLFENEANNIPFETHEQLEVRTKQFVILDYNPVADFWGLHLDGQKIILTYRDNEALDPRIVSSIEDRKHRKGWWKVFGEGELGEIEGAIYTDWHIIGEIPKEARLERYGLDFGYRPDPTAIVAVYLFNGNYILDEVAFSPELKNSNIASIFLNIDRALIVADSAEPKSIDELKGFGLNVVPCEKGADSVKHGIKILQDQVIQVTSRSLNIIKEYRNYLWATDRDGNIIPGVPESGYDHTMDAARYAITSLVPIIRRQEYIDSLPLPRHYRNQRKVNPAL